MMKDIDDMKIGESFYLKRTVAVISERNNRPCEYDEERIDVNALIIDELEKLKAEFDKEIEIKKKQDYSRDFFIGICDCLMLIEFRIDELKGETE